MIKLYVNGHDTDYNEFIFSGGEIHVNLPPTLPFECMVRIEASLTSSNDIMTLMMLNEALSQYDIHCKVLKMAYIPYARQDRRCVKGDAFSLKPFCNLINGMNFDTVEVVDPHSDVATALLDNVKIMSQLQVLTKNEVTKNLMFNTIAISPDAGANKKTNDISVRVCKPFIRADKIRSVTDGQIIGTEVYCDDLDEQEVTIFDDICDGGRTFIELAKKLKKKNAGIINLYVTHGIFSKGYDDLFQSGIDYIFTTDSLNPPENENVTILKL